MQLFIRMLTLITIFAPLLAAAIAGLAGHYIGRRGAHNITILGMLCSFICSCVIFSSIVLNGRPAAHLLLYTWGSSANFSFNVGLLIDRLTAVMMVTVTFVSLLVHVYSIGYMEEDSGYQRFFAYMSLFTFFMLLLVAADNFFVLFFGWEGVGLVSYLLIGFWYQRQAAAEGGLKAFIVNRVGDCGFILGIAAIFAYFHSLDYSTVFSQAAALQNTTFSILPNLHWSVITFICVLLFVGAMAKSAQFPLHVWLPESMEGPTPISALIHAATMVTAGVYMVARMSPLYELSETALSLVLVVGAGGALFLGMIALVQNDIKRVIAYSTMSQLGYMMAANGASAFSAGIFHLMTHACFKALLFLAAGSVIIGLHHEQDMRKMGNLRKYMPITCLTFLIGALAMSAIPPFSGFYSKDVIIEVVQLATIPGANFAYSCLLLGAFITPLYIFRAFFMTFFGNEKYPPKIQKHVKESPSYMVVPLILLAIPSMVIGLILAVPMLSNGRYSILGNTIFVAPQYNMLAEIMSHFPGVLYQTLDSFTHLPFWFSFTGIIAAWLFYVKYPLWPALIQHYLHFGYLILSKKYGIDTFYNWAFVRGAKRLSNFFYQVADMKIIDGFLVDGSGHAVVRFADRVRKLQTGYLYTYALVMMLGLLGFLAWFVWY